MGTAFKPEKTRQDHKPCRSMHLPSVSKLADRPDQPSEAARNPTLKLDPSSAGNQSLGKCCRSPFFWRTRLQTRWRAPFPSTSLREARMPPFQGCSGVKQLATVNGIGIGDAVGSHQVVDCSTQPRSNLRQGVPRLHYVTSRLSTLGHSL